MSNDTFYNDQPAVHMLGGLLLLTDLAGPLRGLFHLRHLECLTLETPQDLEFLRHDSETICCIRNVFIAEINAAINL